MHSSIVLGLRRAARVSLLFFIFAYASFLGVWSADQVAWAAVSAHGIPYPIALFLTLWGMPMLWEVMLTRSFGTDDVVTSELGLLLHLFYLTYGITLCLHHGIDACGPMFLLYWPFSALVLRVIEPAFLWLIRERS